MIKIVTATKNHAEGIFAIETQAFSEPWSLNSIIQEIENKNSICITACDKENVVGYVTMRHVINEGQISNIAVKEEFKKQGIGSKLVEQLIKNAIEKEMIGITLEVRVSNHAAITLYKKHGFIEEGRRKNFYSSPSEDAIIMWKYIEV